MKSHFTWLEYEGLTLCLGVVICIGLCIVEIGVARFQVLPLMFPSMFEVRHRRMLCYNFDITEGKQGKTIRSAAKAMLRLNVCVVLSYLWQHCVLETQQIIDNQFPAWHCEEGFDCFTTDLHYETLLQPTMQHPSLDCSNPDQELPKGSVISCVRFVPPSAAQWLMHIAISHSLSQLNIKTFELLVWIAGGSKLLLYLLQAIIMIFVTTFAGLFLAGLMSAFAASWLAFALSFSFPVFLWLVIQSAKALQKVHLEETQKLQNTFEHHLTEAFRDMEDMLGIGGEGEQCVAASSRNDPQPKRKLSLSQLPRSIRQAASSLNLRRFSRSNSLGHMDTSLLGSTPAAATSGGTEEADDGPRRKSDDAA